MVALIIHKHTTVCIKAAFRNGELSLMGEGLSHCPRLIAQSVCKINVSEVGLREGGRRE